ncbi:MAG: amidohydrolase [Acidimicrobiia bacterium]
MTWHVDGFLDGHSDELCAIRRHVHSHPELSWAEHDTTDLVAQRLQVAGLEPVVLPGGTGLWCDIGAARDQGGGAVVALRADLDALPIDDVKDVPYASQVPGVAHCCGHDVHTTVVLGAGLALAQAAADGGLLERARVRLVFQPAEEAIPGGAEVMIAAGVLDDVVAMFGLHVEPRLDVGTVGVRAGPITSAVDRVRIVLRGPGGHTARPNTTVDLVTVASRVVTDLTLAVNRLTDMRGAANLTFGAVHAGTSANVIPSEAELLGSFRTVDRETWDAAPGLLARLLDDSVRLYGAECELDHARGHPPVVNDAALAAAVRRVGADVLGAGSVVEAQQSLGGDDFAWFLEEVPGCYVRLGARDPDHPESAVDLHASGFDVDERAIGTGVRLLTALALDAAAGVI